MSELKIHELPGNVIYIENAFPESKDFVDMLEKVDGDPVFQKIISPWGPWIDGYPIKTDENDLTKWDFVLLDGEDGERGTVKFVDWDLSLNANNSYWPRVEISPKFSDHHERAYEIIKLIDEPYKKMLDIWSEKTGNENIVSVTKNYTIRKYKTGGNMGPHVDRNVENPENTMDWTSLIYLNDDYEGGQLVFDDLGYELKPSAGSIVFFPCLTSHSVRTVIEGNKIYIFLFMHTDKNIATALGEPYTSLTREIRKQKA